MKNATQDIATSIAMLERARQVLELTYHDWRLHERPVRKGKGARKRVAAGCHQAYVFSAAVKQGAFA